MSINKTVDRLDVWADTKKQCLEGGSKYDVPIYKSIKYEDINVDMKRKYTNTHIHVLDMDTVDCAIDLINKGYNPLLLNMSDIRTSGGAVERGSVAQEENLFRRSNYFKTLLQELYPLNGTSVVYSPKVCFFKENEDENLSRLCSHYLKYAIEFPAKFFLETLFLVLDIPQFDKSSYL